MTSILAPAWIPRGLQPLDGEPLVVIVVNLDYEAADPSTLDGLVVASDLAGTEVEGDEYERLTATGSVTRGAAAWSLFLDDISTTDLTGTGGRTGAWVAWMPPGGTDDDDLLLVGYAPDPGGESNPYTPNWPSGFADYPIRSIDAVLAKLREDVDAAGGGPVSSDDVSVADGIVGEAGADTLTGKLSDINDAILAGGGGGGGFDGAGTVTLLASDTGAFVDGSPSDGAGSIDPKPEWDIVTMFGPTLRLLPVVEDNLLIEQVVTSWGASSGVALMGAVNLGAFGVVQVEFQSDGTVTTSAEGATGPMSFTVTDGQTLSHQYTHDGLVVGYVDGVEVLRATQALPSGADNICVKDDGATLGAFRVSSVERLSLIEPTIIAPTIVEGTTTNTKIVGGTTTNTIIDSSEHVLHAGQGVMAGSGNVQSVIYGVEGYIDNERHVRGFFRAPVDTGLFTGPVADGDQPTTDDGQQVVKGDFVATLGDGAVDPENWIAIVDAETGQWGFVPSTSAATPPAASGWSNSITTNPLTGGSRIVCASGAFGVFEGFRGATSFVRGGPAHFAVAEPTGYWRITSDYTPTTSAHWDGDPTTVAEAIDRLAALAGGTTPIP